MTRTAVAAVVTMSFAFGACGSEAALAATKPADLTHIRTQIVALENELFQTKETESSAASQLGKIRKLLSLQQKEIQLSRKKVAELESSMDELSVQKQALLEKIEGQKVELRRKLRELNKLTDVDALDASWISGLDAENQKSYYLSKTLRKDLERVEQFKRDVREALALELRILEEKNKMDYYVQELNDQMALLSVNEQVQKEILQTNRSSRLEVLKRVRALKESEHEVEKMIASLKETQQSVEVTLAAMKGRLPFPVDGQVLSGFGRSYNPKTSLLTFQKGITVGTRPASEVKAVASGKVVFSGPLNNYGLVVILEHPGQYYTLYGQMGGIAVDNGDNIAQGAPVGRTTGEPLYFEIRNKNIAINPLQWLSNSSITLSKH